MQEINFWFSIGSTYTYLTVKRLRTKINDLSELAKKQLGLVDWN